LRQAPFDRGVLEITGHRPWKMPDRPWIMTQSWHDLLFAHWPVDADRLRPLVPRAFPLDTFNGRAWIGVVPFHMNNVAPRGVPALPWISAFPEINVRTYVTVHDKPGVFFFSLDAANPIAVHVARALFSLPYHRATMDVGWKDEWVTYESVRGSEPETAFIGRYRPCGPERCALSGTLEHFLTERYCLYTTDRAERPYRLEVHHPPWPLQPAELQVSVNTLAAAAGIRLPDVERVLHFSKRLDVVIWASEKLSTR
jgi:hypothetical protein